MAFFDNKTRILVDDLRNEIKPNSKLSIIASCFSIYAYQELKKQLEEIDELRFIFNSPTFVSDQTPKEKREFYIPRLNRERSLYGNEFEVKLRNELTQRAIARECAEWIRRKVAFRSNVSKDGIQGCLIVDKTGYLPFKNFDAVELGCERGDNLNAFTMKVEPDSPDAQELLRSFDEVWRDKSRLQDVKDEVFEKIAAAYNENSPEYVYFIALFNIFNEFLKSVSEDELPNEATGFKKSEIWRLLYNFQRDAALAAINKLEKYNGCILADSVGLGKTFTALAVIKYYENRNKNVLVLCPKKLVNNWNTYKANYVDNPVLKDRLRYDVLFHSDLSRTHGKSYNGQDLERLNWSAYDLVVIDESHNFRNGGNAEGAQNKKTNRYDRLLDQVIRQGVKTKVLMLSATPVNNRFNDLKNQLKLAYEGDVSVIDSKLNLSRSLDDVFKSAQQAFNRWSKLELQERTTERLLKELSFDFFEVLDAVTIARSRKHVENYYDTSEIGTFPTRLKPISLRPGLTDLKNSVQYGELYEILTELNLSVYTPSKYILPSRLDKYEKEFKDNQAHVGFTQQNRELGLRRLMSINLLKRLESSVRSFSATIERISENIRRTINVIDEFLRGKQGEIDATENNFSSLGNFDDDDAESADFFAVGKNIRIDLNDMDCQTWRETLEQDLDDLNVVLEKIKDVDPEHDAKLNELKRVLAEKFQRPINEGNRKVLIFTAFADTAEYLFEHVGKFVKENFGLDSAMITGSVDGRTTIPKMRADMNDVLAAFSPASKNVDPAKVPKIDVLVATDCISEGQNLQDCDYQINYDVHWNPVRIIQRFGRIDRIGSRNKKIQLVVFWPDVSLDDYIALKSKVETRMEIVNLSATGDDNVLSQEKIELEYRKAQLKRLQEEVVDLEETSTGVSIVDLGLNEFRLDLLEYVKTNPNLDQTPFGLHSVARATKNAPPGVVFVLKNRSDGVNVDRQNRLHPFYMVYVGANGEIVCDHLSPKEILDKLRVLCKGESEPIPELYRPFNQETRDGRKMEKYSRLLNDAIFSIVDVKEQRDVDSLFTPGNTTALGAKISGLDDFELICFLVVR